MSTHAFYSFCSFFEVQLAVATSWMARQHVLRNVPQVALCDRRPENCIHLLTSARHGHHIATIEARSACRL